MALFEILKLWISPKKVIHIFDFLEKGGAILLLRHQQQLKKQLKLD